MLLYSQNERYYCHVTSVIIVNYSSLLSKKYKIYSPIVKLPYSAEIKYCVKSICENTLATLLLIYVYISKSCGEIILSFQEQEQQTNKFFQPHKLWDFFIIFKYRSICFYILRVEKEIMKSPRACEFLHHSPKKFTLWEVDLIGTCHFGKLIICILLSFWEVDITVWYDIQIDSVRHLRCEVTLRPHSTLAVYSSSE